ncbi:beta alanine synthase [Wallemia mellicola]|uniref:Beta alanine synthase n=1 Tax=Wallemia mellicola TaxID=1708541 RepID=A0AB74KBL7_9BASI|nr:beta alanine synthase [Wallemia mellicola]
MQYETLKINGPRLNATLQETCDEYGTDHRYGDRREETGMCRLALTDADKGIRDWLVNEVTKLGCEVRIDKMGNMFCIRPGRLNSSPIGIGSHLDTQPMGGRYDGILGVQSALEILRTLNETKYETFHPICLINWTNVEGARFPNSLHGSSVYAGILPLEQAHSLKAVIGEGVSTLDELKRINYHGIHECNYKANPLKAYFEYHIEQGHILDESENQMKIGVVHQATCYRWFTLRIKGRESHTGATPFDRRSDSVLTGAQIILTSTEIAKRLEGLFSTGIFEAKPGSVNTTASYVEMSVDLRHESNEILDVLESEVIKTSVDIAKQMKCELEWEKSIRSDVRQFDSEVVRSITKAATDTVGDDKHIPMRTWAGHDCCAVSSTGIPAAMIFCPSRDGITHNPREYTSSDDCATGAQVLLQAVLDYDCKMASRGA